MNAPAGSGRARVALVCGLLHAGPTAISKYLIEKGAWFGIGGAARKSLQTEVLLKYLQMAPRSRDQVGAAGFVAMLTRDAPDAVDNGFMQLYTVAAAFGRVVCILLYSSFYAPRAMVIQLFLIAFMLLRVYLREAVSTALRLKFLQAANRILELATDVASSYPILRDARLKPAVAQNLNRAVANVNYLKNAVSAQTIRTQLALPVASAWSVGGLMILAPYFLDVLNMTPGTFLATLSSTTSMGVQLDSLSKALGLMQSSLASLMEVHTFLSMPTETDALMLDGKKQQERGRKVAEDSTLQKKSRKADAKWMKKFGLGHDVERHQSELALRRTQTEAQGLGEATDKRRSRLTIRQRLTETISGSGLSPSFRSGLSPRCTVSDETSLCSESESRLSSSASFGSVSSSPKAMRDASPMVSSDPEPDPTADDMLIELLDVSMRPGVDSAEELDTHRKPSSHTSSDQLLSPLSRQPAALPQLSLVEKANLQLKQGRIYAVVGHGKADLLRLLAKVNYPAHGEVFVPPHLAIEHLEQEPMFLRRTSLYDNILLRVPRENRPAVMRVTKLCKELGLAPKWLDYVQASGTLEASMSATETLPTQLLPDEDFAATVRLPGEKSASERLVEEQAWELQLSVSEKTILHLAMALIADPHLLVLHRPLQRLESGDADNVRKALRKFVDERGMSQTLRDTPGVLARTVILSCAASDAATLQICDGIIITGRPMGGATLFEADMLLSNDFQQGDSMRLTTTSRGEQLSQKVSELLPKMPTATAEKHRQQLTLARSCSSLLVSAPSQLDNAETGNNVASHRNLDATLRAETACNHGGGNAKPNSFKGKSAFSMV